LGAKKKPQPKKPDTEKSHPENPPQLNNIYSLKNDLTKKNTPPYSPPDLPGGSGIPLTFHCLKPIALKLFGQSNRFLLTKLYREIAEFAIDDEVVNECVKRIDISQIKYNPYGYFKTVYAATVAVVNNRKLIREEMRLIEEQSRASITAENEITETVAEARARARAILGIASKPAHVTDK
jgi:hypothetical protein